MNKISFKYKFILSFVIIQIIFLSMIAAVNFRTIEKNDKDFIAFKKASFSSMLQQQLVTPISVYDVATIDNIIGELAKMDSVMAISVWDTEDVLLSNIANTSEDLKKFVHLDNTILNEGLTIGKSSIWLDLKEHHEQIYYNKLYTGLIIIIEILISTLLSWLIGYKLAKNLGLLTEYSENISNNIDTPIPQMKDSKEIEVLASTLETMRQQINHETTELKLAKIQAEQATKAKSDFLANMSHEIRTPMTGILGFINQLTKGEKDPNRLKQFHIIKGSGHTLLAIINDILDFSKIESGKFELESSPYNLNKLFESSMDIFDSLASSKNINLHKTIDDNLPQCIIGDQVRLKQVIFNLMSNAIKFTKEEGDVTLQTHYASETKTIHISVIDTGVGIAKENLEKIFEAFSQEDTSTTRKFGGTGLGLSISSHLVKLMGSELKVESTVHKGSKFYFDMPVEVCSEDTINNSFDVDEQIDSNVDLKGHVLVVEDNKTNQMLMKIILDDLGVTYDITNDGAEGVLNFKLNKYDVILMDENMPIMNGIEASKHIREIEEEKSLTPIPIIAVTANALTGDKEKFIEAGMDDYIPKPYAEKDIVKVLQKYLG